MNGEIYKDMTTLKSNFKRFVVNMLEREDLWKKLNNDYESEFDRENLSENHKENARIVLHGMER